MFWAKLISKAHKELFRSQGLGIAGLILVREKDQMMLTYWPDFIPDEFIREYYAAIAAGKVPEKFKP
jgi:hypothetical protein